MSFSNKSKKKNEENQQEENLLDNNQLEEPLNSSHFTTKTKKRKYLPFLPKIYWFFYSKPIYFLAFIPSLINGFVTTGETISLAYVIDGLKKENGLQLLKKYVFYQLMLIIINSLFTFITEYSWSIINSLITIKMRRVVFKSYMMKDIEFFDKKSLGELLSILNDEISDAGEMCFESKSQVIFSCGRIVSGLILCLSINWKLTLFALGITLFNSKIINGYYQFGLSKMLSRFQHMSDSTNMISEAISNIKTVFSFNRQKKLLNDYDHECNELVKLEQESYYYFQTPSHLLTVLSSGALCTFLNIGSFYVLKKQMTPGFLFTISQEAFNLASEIELVVSALRQEKRIDEHMKNVFDVIDYESTFFWFN